MRWGTKRVPALGGLLLACLLVASLASPALGAGKTVHITKSDSGGNAVPGATFTLYVDAPPVGNGPPKGAEDTAVAGTCTTAANGQCDITNVPAGDYWVSETGPPAGYTPAADSTLKVKKKNREVVVVNDRTPANVSVNDPTGDASVDDGTHIFQFGPAVAADATGDRVFVAYNDSAGFYTPGGLSGLGAAFSDDGGETFADLGKAPPGPNVLLGEPTVVYDPIGDRWVLATDSFFVQGNAYERPIAVGSWSPGSGWGPLVNTFPDIPSGASAHNPSITTWDELLAVAFTLSRGDGQSEGMVTTSTDGGQTWSQPASVTGLGTFDFISATPGPDGRLFSVWSDYGGADATTNDFFFSVSVDGGATWSDGTPIAQDVPKSGTPGSCATDPSFAYVERLRAADAPRVAVSPFHPDRIFTLFPAQGGSGDESDLLLSTSTDGGVTWGPPQRVPTSTGATEMMPDMGVSAAGSLDIAYYSADLFDRTLDFYALQLDVFSPEDPIGTLRVVHRLAGPTPLWDTATPFDTAYSPCFGLQGLEIDARGSGLFVAWTDGRDAGPAGNEGVDPNISFAHVEGWYLTTTTAVSASTTSTKVRVGGTVTPPPIPGTGSVRVTLYRDVGGGFRKVARTTVTTGTGGRFSALFARPDGGRCSVTASFLGAEERMPSAGTRTFAC